MTLSAKIDGTQLMYEHKHEHEHILSIHHELVE